MSAARTTASDGVSTGDVVEIEPSSAKEPESVADGSADYAAAAAAAAPEAQLDVGCDIAPPRYNASPCNPVMHQSRLVRYRRACRAS